MAVTTNTATSGQEGAASGEYAGTECQDPSGSRGSCCPLYHEAVELVGRRWTGAILSVLMDGPLRFTEIAQSVPELSDRLLSERMKELESRGIVCRTVHAGPPARVEYGLSAMGEALGPALAEIQRWARQWLGSDCSEQRQPSSSGQH
jgi:DNA-binding HxlR family transcriptional regulator